MSRRSYWGSYDPPFGKHPGIPLDKYIVPADAMFVRYNMRDCTCKDFPLFGKEKFREQKAHESNAEEGCLIKSSEIVPFLQFLREHKNELFLPTTSNLWNSEDYQEISFQRIDKEYFMVTRSRIFPFNWRKLLSKKGYGEMKHFRFHYDATAYGDADIAMEYDGQRMSFGATYVGSNPLRDFIEILPELVTGAEAHACMRWSSEPGELKVNLHVSGKDVIIRAEEYGDTYDFSTADDSKWNTVFEAIVPLEEVVSAVIEEAERNVRKHGIVGLSETWEKDAEVFPLSAYLKLEGASCNLLNDSTYASDVKEEIRHLQDL